MAFFLLKLYFYRFLYQIRNQRPNIRPLCKISASWTKDKGVRISTSNDRENSLMTSYSRDSDDVMKNGTITTSLVVIGPQIMKKRTGAQNIDYKAFVARFKGHELVLECVFFVSIETLPLS